MFEGLAVPGRGVELDSVKEEINLCPLRRQLPPDQVELAVPFLAIHVAPRLAIAGIAVLSEDGVGLLQSEVGVFEDRRQLAGIDGALAGCAGAVQGRLGVPGLGVEVAQVFPQGADGRGDMVKVGAGGAGPAVDGGGKVVDGLGGEGGGAGACHRAGGGCCGRGCVVVMWS